MKTDLLKISFVVRCLFCSLIFNKNLYQLTILGLTEKISHAYRRVDYSVGKKLFGNTVGVKNNLTGTVMKVRRAKILDVNEINNNLVSELKSKQFLMLEHPYDDELIDSIRIKYEKMIENDETSYVTGQHNGKVYSRHIREPWKRIPELEKLITDDISNILRGYYNGYFDVRLIEIHRNYHIPKELEEMELFSNHWHCDNRSTEFLKIFVCISDVTEDNGPFHCIPPQRTKELIKKGFGTREDYNLPIEEIEDPKYLVKAIGKVGAAYFANPQMCLHRASNPAPGKHRDIVHIVFGPASKPLAENWLSTFVQGKDYTP